MTNPYETLHKQLKKHLDTIQELREKLSDLKDERDQLAELVTGLQQDNAWLESQLFDKEKD